jgi:ankyrin repeat protein
VSAQYLRTAGAPRWYFTPQVVGHARVVERLLQEGVSPGIKDKDFSTVMHSTATGGNLEVVELVLKNGGGRDPEDKSRSTPLMCAATPGHIEVVRRLLEWNPNPRYRTFMAEQH